MFFFIVLWHKCFNTNYFCSTSTYFSAHMLLATFNLHLDLINIYLLREIISTCYWNAKANFQETKRWTMAMPIVSVLCVFRVTMRINYNRVLCWILFHKNALSSKWKKWASHFQTAYFFDFRKIVIFPSSKYKSNGFASRYFAFFAGLYYCVLRVSNVLVVLKVFMYNCLHVLNLNESKKN